MNMILKIIICKKNNNMKHLKTFNERLSFKKQDNNHKFDQEDITVLENDNFVINNKIAIKEIDNIKFIITKIYKGTNVYHSEGREVEYFQYNSEISSNDRIITTESDDSLNTLLDHINNHIDEYNDISTQNNSRNIRSRIGDFFKSKPTISDIVSYTDDYDDNDDNDSDYW